MLIQIRRNEVRYSLGRMLQNGGAPTWQKRSVAQEFVSKQAVVPGGKVLEPQLDRIQDRLRLFVKYLTLPKKKTGNEGGLRLSELSSQHQNLSFQRLLHALNLSSC